MKMKVELGKQTDFGDLFTVPEFIQYCDTRSFIDSDGVGHLATATRESNVSIYPSEVRKTLTLNPWATHVMWFNK